MLGGAASQIFGALNANGQVFLINPAGITFGQGASVNVGGLVASTMGITDANFLAGNYVFQRDGSTGAIVNKGTLTAGSGGYIGLLAPEVINKGVITATLGTVALAAGEAVTLDFSGDGLVGISVDPAQVRTLIANHNLIAAPDGRVLMSAQAADTLLGGVINNSGAIEADSLAQGPGGSISLLASNTINLGAGGSLDAGKGGQVSVIAGGTANLAGSIVAPGGNVETSGNVLNFGTGLTVTTGNWVLDPYDLELTASAATAISTALGSGNVLVQTTANSATTGFGGNVNSSGNGDITLDSGATIAGPAPIR